MEITYASTPNTRAGYARPHRLCEYQNCRIIYSAALSRGIAIVMQLLIRRLRAMQRLRDALWASPRAIYDELRSLSLAHADKTAR